MSYEIMDMKNAEDWEKIFNIFSDGIYITNAKGLTLKVNKAYEEITGIPAVKLIGRYMVDIVNDGILSTSITSRVIEEKTEVIVEQEINGGKKVVLRGIPIFEDGSIKMVVTFVRDNTVIKKAQEELDRSKARMELYRKRIEEISTKKKYVAESKEFKEAITIARKVADYASTVLVLGESGTGKEVIAREIHESSHRHKNLFLKINCGAIPENLLEAELFGYEGGAFTGAKKNGHVGVFEMADKGTLFLDEIGDMPLALQVKLLRVLQEKTITRIGSTKPITIDTRVIAATNLELEQMVKDKLFRKDLYYRLNVVSIKIPPLRDRMADLPGMVDFFVNEINEKYSMKKKIMPSMIKRFMEYDWPGNVRELENITERVMVTSEENEIHFREGGFYWLEKENDFEQGIDEFMDYSLKDAFEEFEKKIMTKAAQQYKTTYEIADALQISQPSVSRKLKKHMIKMNKTEE